MAFVSDPELDRIWRESEAYRQFQRSVAKFVRRAEHADRKARQRARQKGEGECGQ